MVSYNSKAELEFLLCFSKPDNPLENSTDTVAGGRDSQAKKPTVDISFEKLLREVAKFDEEQVKGWKEDIDTLLVFVSLFYRLGTHPLILLLKRLVFSPLSSQHSS
jgi:hypothetical protein